MTQGMQTALCYIREVNNSNNYNAFLSDHGILQGWKQFPDIYLLFENIQHIRGLCGWGFSWVWGFLGFGFGFFFNGQVAIGSLQAFGTWYSLISQLWQVKQEAPNWFCLQLEAHSSTASMNISVKFISWEGTGDICFPQTSAPVEPGSGEVLRAQPGKPGQSHTRMNYLLELLQHLPHSRLYRIYF